MRILARIFRAVPWLVLFATGSAWGFDNQWHLGAGAGIAAQERDPSLGPGFVIHGAYGLSDLFDARLELLNSWHGSSPMGAALLGLTYKLDVIQVIPWGGLAVGGYFFSDALTGKGRSNFEPGAAALLGIDYAWAREWGASLALGMHFMPLIDDNRSPLALRYTTFLLRFEHRWGW